MELRETKRSSNASGFTLLELMVVLFLITLIAGISAATFSSSLSSGKLDATARELVAMMKHARSLSLMKGGPQSVTIDLDEGTYRLEDRAARHFMKGMTVTVTDPLSGERRDGRHIFVFDPLGTIEGKTILLTFGKRSLLVRADPVVAAVVERKQ